MSLEHIFLTLHRLIHFLAVPCVQPKYVIFSKAPLCLCPGHGKSGCYLHCHVGKDVQMYSEKEN